MPYRHVRTRLGMKVDIDRQSISGLYDLSNGLMSSVGHDAITLSSPCEFDMFLMHVFPSKGFNMSKPFQQLERVDENFRYIELPDDDEEPPDPYEILKDAKLSSDIMEWLSDLRVGYGFGHCMMDTRRLSLWDPYWKLGIKDKEMPDIVKSTLDLCSLSCMGYTQNITDINRCARKLKSNEFLRVMVETYTPPPRKVTIEVAFDGILFR